MRIRVHALTTKDGAKVGTFLTGRESFMRPIGAIDLHGESLRDIIITADGVPLVRLPMDIPAKMYEQE